MLASIGEFARYFEGVRRRTWAAVDRLTPELLEWRPSLLLRTGDRRRWFGTGPQSRTL
jgi:hypothetical protein